jgi:hypothetical protein
MSVFGHSEPHPELKSKVSADGTHPFPERVLAGTFNPSTSSGWNLVGLGTLSERAVSGSAKFVDSDQKS